MTDFEQGRDQALANVDAILTEEMRGWVADSIAHKVLVRLRRRVHLLAPPATEMRLVGTPFVVTLDEDVEESL